MTSSKLSPAVVFFVFLAFMTGCGGGGGGGTAAPAPAPPPALLSIIVSPTHATTAAGTTEQFTATGSYADNSARDLTAVVNWTSAATGVASISATGVATAATVGSTTITASSGGISSTAALTVTAAAAAAANEIPITVGGALCAANPYPNKPCVSVTVCAPGTTNCQTINDILLDTGSFGLRIFSQALTVIPRATGGLAECIQFGDGTSVWGPVQTADVKLGGEPAVTVPIQVIDATFGTIPAVCTNALPSPAAARYSGILGVGLFTHDCGTGCVSSANNGLYYSCSGAGCSGTAVPLANQVQNPTSLLPQDNNGVLIRLPSVPLGGMASADGTLILGIGTQSNNAAPLSVTAYAASATTGELTTHFGGQNYPSFFDTGSNGLLFTPPAADPIPACPGNGGWFCPSFTTSFSATIAAAAGTPSGTVPFQIGNFASITANTANQVFVEIGGPFSVNFDWGLPFFFGRDVFVGFSGATSSLGTGPYFAY